MVSKQTLQKYGLTANEWQAMYDKYGGACHACRKIPPSGKLNVDHKHVKNWKKLPPEMRKLCVRGLTCFICNYKLLAKGISPERLRNVANYLEVSENLNS